jgi:hypothetical protein
LKVKEKKMNQYSTIRQEEFDAIAEEEQDELPVSSHPPIREIILEASTRPENSEKVKSMLKSEKVEMKEEKKIKKKIKPSKPNASPNTGSKKATKSKTLNKSPRPDLSSS